MGPQERGERCVRNPTQLFRPRHPPRAVDASLLGVPAGHRGRQPDRDDLYVGSGPKMECHAVGLTVSRIYARGHGHAPIRVRQPGEPTTGVGAPRPATSAPCQSALDQACSWRTRSLSIAKMQRPWPKSSNSISSGSMYSWWQSSHRPPGMPKQRRSLRSGSRKVVSKRVLTRRLPQRGQRSRAPVIAFDLWLRGHPTA